MTLTPINNQKKNHDFGAGLSGTDLHIIIHGFVLDKVTKPDGEHDLQVALPSQAWSLAPMTIPGMVQLATNTDNIVKKLVTIFADHPDSCIVTNNQNKHLKTTATSGSGQLSVQMTLIPFAGTGKNCAILSSYRDSSQAYRDKSMAGYFVE